MLNFDKDTYLGVVVRLYAESNNVERKNYAVVKDLDGIRIAEWNDENTPEPTDEDLNSIYTQYIHGEKIASKKKEISEFSSTYLTPRRQFELSTNSEGYVDSNGEPCLETDEGAQVFSAWYETKISVLRAELSVLETE